MGFLLLAPFFCQNFQGRHTRVLLLDNLVISFNLICCSFQVRQSTETMIQQKNKLFIICILREEWVLRVSLASLSSLSFTKSVLKQILYFCINCHHIVKLYCEVHKLTVQLGFPKRFELWCFFGKKPWYDILHRIVEALLE